MAYVLLAIMSTGGLVPTACANTFPQKTTIQSGILHQEIEVQHTVPQRLTPVEPKTHRALSREYQKQHTATTLPHETNTPALRQTGTPQPSSLSQQPRETANTSTPQPHDTIATSAPQTHDIANTSVPQTHNTITARVPHQGIEHSISTHHSLQTNSIQASDTSSSTAPRTQQYHARNVPHDNPVESQLEHMDVYSLSPHAHKLALPHMIPEETRALIQYDNNKTDWTHIIANASALTGLDKALIAAVIFVESGYNTLAESSKGAQGLMQLMPATQQDLGIDDPFNPRSNVEAGSRYLQQQLMRFTHLELALAAYNAGPANVQRYKGIPPFKETQHFVRKVVQRYQYYQQHGLPQ